VLPDAENPNVDFRSVIWFGMEAGDNKTREILVRSAGDITQAVSFAVFDLAFENGEELVDTTAPGQINDWVTVSPANVLLEPGEEVRISISIAVPEGAEDRAFQSSLRVLAADGRDVEPNDEGGFKAIIGGAAAVDIDLWLGIGDALSLVPKFEITDLFGVIDGQDKYLRVIFSNTGVVPLELTGAVEFSDQTFEGRTFGPYEYQYVGLQGGEQGYVDIPIAQEIQEGPWDIYVRARQGNIRESRVFTLELSFRDISGFDIVSLLPLLLSLLLIFAIVFGLRLIRAGNSDRANYPSPNQARGELETEVENIDTEIQASQKKKPTFKMPKLIIPEIKLPEPKLRVRSSSQKPASKSPAQPPKAPSKLRPEPKREPVKTEFDIELDSWAESLRSSIREVRSDSTDLVEKYKDVPTRKPRKTKPKD